MRLAWPERVILVLAALELLALLILGGTADHIPELGARLPALGEISFKLFMFTIAPVWVVLRVLDLVFDGPAKRAGRFIVQRLD